MGITEDAKAVAGGAVTGGKRIAVGYWRGLVYPFRGAAFVYFRHPGLIRFWIFPILISLALTAGVIGGGWAAREPLTDAILGAPTVELHKPRHFYDKAKGKPHKPRLKPLGDADTRWMGDAGRVALEWVLLGLFVGLGLVVVVLLANVIAAPFNDLLSEEVEHLLLGIRGPPFSWKVLLRDTVRTIGLEGVKWSAWLLVMGLLFLLSFVFPAVGHVISTVVGFLFTTMYLALDFIDWPASRRNRSLTYRFGLLTEHFLPMLGFGTGVWVFLFLPFVNLLFMPAAVAGGTMLFLDMEGRMEGRTAGHVAGDDAGRDDTAPAPAG